MSEDAHHHTATSLEFEILETAIRELLIDKGVIGADDIQRQIEAVP
jgi:hypothetical protein